MITIILLIATLVGMASIRALRHVRYANPTYLLITHGPLYFVLLAAYFANPAMEFVEINFEAIAATLGYILLSVITHELFFQALQLDVHKAVAKISAPSNIRSEKTLAVTLAIAVCLLGGRQLYQLLAEYNFQIFIVATEDFEHEYMQGVLRFIAMLLCVYLVGFGKNWLEHTIAIALFIILIFTFVKGVILISAISGFAIRILLGDKIRLNHLLKLLSVVAVAFLSSYALRSWFLDSGTVWEGVATTAAKIYFYLVSGVSSLAVNLAKGFDFSNDSYVLATPFLNLLGITPHGDRVVPSDITGGTFTNIAYQSFMVDTYSNVNTFFGSLFLYSGSWAASAIITTLLIGMTLGQFKLASILNSRWILASAALNTSAFTLSFFEYYHWHSFFFYIFGIAVGLEIATRGIRVSHKTRSPSIRTIST